MGNKLGWFGPSKDEVWRQLSNESDDITFIDGGFWRDGRVEAKHGEWNILLDVETVSDGESYRQFTRFRASYVNADNFRFAVYRESLLSGIGKFFGMEDIEVGYGDLDNAYIIVSVRTLCAQLNSWNDGRCVRETSSFK